MNKKYQDENINKIKCWSNQIGNYDFEKRNICNIKINQRDTTKIPIR